jgi:exonuclease VII large subunit
MLTLHVVDDTTKAQAAQYGAQANAYISKVNALFEEPTAAANKVHKFLTGLRSKFTGTAQGVVDHCRREIADYDARVEQARLKLQRELQAEEDRKARLKAEEERKAQIAEAKRLQEEVLRKQQEAEDDAMPWEKETVTAAASTQVVEIQQKLEALAAAPIVYEAPQIIVPEAPKVDGAGSRNTPLKYRVVDLNALIQAAAKNPALQEYLEVNDTMAKAKLKMVGEKLGDFLPGLEAYRDKTVSFR